MIISSASIYSHLTETNVFSLSKRESLIDVVIMIRLLQSVDELLLAKSKATVINRANNTKCLRLNYVMCWGS